MLRDVLNKYLKGWEKVGDQKIDKINWEGLVDNICEDYYTNLVGNVIINEDGSYSYKSMDGNSDENQHNSIDAIKIQDWEEILSEAVDTLVQVGLGHTILYTNLCVILETIQSSNILDVLINDDGFVDEFVEELND